MSQRCLVPVYKIQNTTVIWLTHFEGRVVDVLCCSLLGPNRRRTKFSREQTLVSICSGGEISIQLRAQAHKFYVDVASLWLLLSNIQFLHRACLPERNSQVTGVSLALKHSSPKHVHLRLSTNTCSHTFCQ